LPNPSHVMSHLIWPMLGLVGFLFVLAWLLWWVRAWLRDSSEDDGCSPLLLSEYREMVTRGELSEEEFRNIKDGLMARFGVGSSPAPSRNVRPQFPAAPRPAVESGKVAEGQESEDAEEE
jgi:hypothetical protein